ALSGAARERLSAHVLRCRHCTCALAELRLARDVLRRSGTASAGPTPGLSRRLRAIGDMPTPPPTATATATATLDRHEPRAARGPYRSVPVGMAVVLVALATVTGIGWFSAPTREAAMADPGHRAEGAFAASVAAAPLGSAATAAVMTAPRTPLATRPTRLDATPIRPGAPVPQRELAALLAGTGPEVAHDGVWQVDVRADGTALTARVRVESRPGQGTQYTVHSDAGQQVAASFVADDRARPPADLAGLLPAGATARSGQQVAGREAVMVEASGTAELVRRWWLDRATGLLLRTETLVGGAVTSQAGFHDLHVGPEPTFLSHLQPQLGMSAAGLAMSNSHALSLQTHGWFCREDLAGLPLFAAHGDSMVTPQRLRLTYGDAAQQVTVLQEPGTLPETLPGFIHDPTRD